MMNIQLLTAFVLLGVAMAADYRVTLGISQVTGQAGVGFDPNRIVPAAGDTITFSWAVPAYIQNPPTGSYSATQGTFENPCKPMAGGFDSGPRNTAAESSGQGSTMTFTIRDDKPLYFFSTVGDQCKEGMVFGANTPASGAGSIDAYITAAGGNPNANANTSNSTSSTPTSSSTTTTADGTASNNVTNPSSTNTTRAATSASVNSNSTSAKPQNSAGALDTPHSLLASIGLLTASLFL